MLRWLQLAAVCGVVLVWSNEAFAIVQNTDVAVTKPAGETGSATLTLTQKDSSNRPVKTDTIRVARNQPRARQNVRIDPDIAKTVDVTIETEKGKRTVTVDVTRLLGGGPVELGEGFAIQGTPSAAGTPRRATSNFRIAENESPRPTNRGGYYMQPSGVNGASTFMPNFFFGLVGGASNLGSDGNGANLVSLDTFGGGSIVNTRAISTPGPQGSLGFLGTAAFPLPMAANGAPMPTTFGVTSGMLFGSERDVTTSFSFAGTVPAGAGTVNIKDSAGTPLLFEFGFPVRRNVVFLLGGGGIFSSRETTVTVQEGGAAGTPAFSRTIEQSFFDPAITAGLRLGVADLNNNGRTDVFLGARALVVFKQDGDPVVLQSPNFPSQSYTANSNRGGTEASIFASLDVNLSDFFALEPSRRPVTVSDIRLKRDITRVGQLESGLPLYRYRYLWSDQVYVGVMAQEVADVAPDAVVKGDDGYLRVNYVSLGTSMKTWEQWSAARGWLSREAN
jgi:hypothetical protein